MRGVAESLDALGIVLIGWLLLGESTVVGKGIMSIGGILLILNWVVHLGTSGYYGQIAEVQAKKMKERARNDYLGK